MNVCANDNCAGCMLCVETCPKKAIAIVDNYDSYNAVIDEEKCVGCGMCHERCPQNSEPIKMSPVRWYQGWSNDGETRKQAPSGGIGMALISEFIAEGGYVCSCIYDKGSFSFCVTNDYKEAKRFSGSKYVKSNPLGIYNRVLKLLKEEQKVLFIGLPCQVAALKKYVGPEYEKKLFLIDLICHGTPSPRLLELFLSQYHKSLNSISEILFRIKAKMQIVVDKKGIVCKGVSDKYTIAFLNGLTYTNNCYSCKYASMERVSDITIGDSWGTDLPFDEVRKGVSLMLVQTDKGDNLLKKANVVLVDVDKKKALDNNMQLVRPMERPKKRSSFFGGLEKKSFNQMVLCMYPKTCLKQDFKFILIKMGLIRQ